MSTRPRIMTGQTIYHGSWAPMSWERSWQSPSKSFKIWVLVKINMRKCKWNSAKGQAIGIFISLPWDSQILCSTCYNTGKKGQTDMDAADKWTAAYVLCTICMRSPCLIIFITSELLNVVIILQKHIQLKSSKKPMHIITSVITQNITPFSSYEKQKLVQFLVLCLYTFFFSQLGSKCGQLLIEERPLHSTTHFSFPSRLPYLPLLWSY